MENLDIFEIACKYFSQELTDFKDILSRKVKALEKIEWVYDKGNIKVCEPDEKDRRKRCKVGLKYSLKVEISADDVELIWNEFNIFFEKTYIKNIERLSNNEEIGRYQFVATNSKGDSIGCMIYLAGEWNIPQITLLAFVADRYKKSDFIEEIKK